MSPPRTVRAVMRLFELAACTAFYGARVGVGLGPRARTTQEWSRDLCQRFGIALEIVGEPPPPGVLHVSNHRSYADIIVLGACSQTNFVAKDEVRRFPLMGWAARRAGTVFVKREDRHSGATAMKSIAERIQGGESVTVFPEGTTVGPPGVGAFQRGVFRLAAQRALPISPIAIEYEFPGDAWTDASDASFFPHFVKTFSRKRVAVRVAFGAPVRDTDADRLRAATSEWISANLRRPGGAQ